jgi:hypothetical protein
MSPNVVPQSADPANPDSAFPLSPSIGDTFDNSKNILIGEQGDILARYRIPI